MNLLPLLSPVPLQARALERQLRLVQEELSKAREQATALDQSAIEEYNR